MMVILDKSSSMQTGTIGGATKWSIAADALDTVTTEFDDKLETGLMIFPEPNQCAPGSVFVQPALGTRDAIVSELASAPPSAGNWTPMAQSLSAAAGEPSLMDTTVPRYAVLITDGWQWCSPYDASTRFDPVNAVAELGAIGVTTYVVGFGAGVDALVLNGIAVTAGTARPGCDPTGDTPMAADPCYYQADSPTELVDALTEIADTAVDEICDGEDNDCDGMIDEGLTQECGTDCGTGTETCDMGTWVGCDAPQPSAEVCDGEDNNCDGTVDPGCACVAGETRPCGTGETTGACEAGVQTCGADGTWGVCEGAVGPGSEMCDGDDNDCDGYVDETVDDAKSLCPLGQWCNAGDCEDLEPENPTPDDDSDEDGFGADSEPGSCGCGAASGSETAGGLLLLLLVGALLRRRRRGGLTA